MLYKKCYLDIKFSYLLAERVLLLAIVAVAQLSQNPIQLVKESYSSIVLTTSSFLSLEQV